LDGVEYYYCGLPNFYDPLGIGRRVRAFHPVVWEKDDWNETFSEIEIKPDITVEVTRTGILK
jgi:spore germination protein KC